MPERSLRPCKQRGCKSLTRNEHGYCEEHIEDYLKRIEGRRKQRHKTYRSKRTDVDEQKFYKSKEWIRLRDYIKIKYGGLCLYSYFIDKKIVNADMDHHIVEIKENWNLRLDEDNVIPLCNAVHNKVHSLYNTDKKKEVQDMLRGLLRKWECRKTKGI